jgi:hypothetical protein
VNADDTIDDHTNDPRDVTVFDRLKRIIEGSPEGSLNQH